MACDWQRKNEIATDLETKAQISLGKQTAYMYILYYMYKIMSNSQSYCHNENVENQRNAVNIFSKLI